MGQKIMLEAVHPVVDGNTVVVAPGNRWESLDQVPDGVPVRPVIVDVPDEPMPKPAPAKPAPKPGK